MNMALLLKLLRGKKTYLVAICIGVLATVNALGYIDDETYKTLLGMLNGLGLFTLGAKMNRVGKDVNPFS